MHTVAQNCPHYVCPHKQVRTSPSRTTIVSNGEFSNFELGSKHLRMVEARIDQRNGSQLYRSTHYGPAQSLPIRSLEP